MSKLQDKLTASLKPQHATTPVRKAGAKHAPAPAQTVARAKPAKARQAPLRASLSDAVPPQDLNDPVPALHPVRIWPD